MATVDVQEDKEPMFVEFTEPLPPDAIHFDVETDARDDIIRVTPWYVAES